MNQATDTPKAKQPPALFPNADTALASGDTRKLFELEFKGIKGTVFCYAISEHQAQLALIQNVTTVRKVSRADRAKLIAEAYSRLLREKAESATPPPAAPVSPVAEADRARFEDAQPAPAEASL